MKIQDLVRERVIGNIKTGMKGENGVPKKLSYFNVEEDKGTTYEMVDIFKQLYPNKPTTIKIRFTSENPFNFKFKRYVNGKAVCIGNGTKAITVGKDTKNNNTQIEIECDEECPHRQSGKCKLKGSLKFVLDGIEAGGVWNLSTSGGISLSNIASEIVKYKKAGMSIIGVPFELTLTEQQSLAYGTYYSIDLRRTDIKPQLVTNSEPQLTQTNVQEMKQLAKPKEKEKKEKKVVEVEPEKDMKNNIVEDKGNKEESKKDGSNYFVVKGFMPEEINGNEFNKIIFQDENFQDIEYILHPRANQEILKEEIGTLVEIKETKIEMNKNILCKYEIKAVVSSNGLMEKGETEELKEAV